MTHQPRTLVVVRVRLNSGAYDATCRRPHKGRASSTNKAQIAAERAACKALSLPAGAVVESYLNADLFRCMDWHVWLAEPPAVAKQS